MLMRGLGEEEEEAGGKGKKWGDEAEIPWRLCMSKCTRGGCMREVALGRRCERRVTRRCVEPRSKAGGRKRCY